MGAHGVESGSQSSPALQTYATKTRECDKWQRIYPSRNGHQTEILLTIAHENKTHLPTHTAPDSNLYNLCIYLGQARFNGGACILNRYAIYNIAHRVGCYYDGAGKTIHDSRKSVSNLLDEVHLAKICRLWWQNVTSMSHKVLDVETKCDIKRRKSSLWWHVTTKKVSHRWHIKCRARR
jgi:hypothetical protein